MLKEITIQGLSQSYAKKLLFPCKDGVSRRPFTIYKHGK